MSEQMIVVPNHVVQQLQQQQQTQPQQQLKYPTRSSLYQQIGQYPPVQYSKQASLDSNNVYIQSPVIKKSINHSFGGQIIQQGINSPKSFESSSRQIIPQGNGYIKGLGSSQKLQNIGGLIQANSNHRQEVEYQLQPQVIQQLQQQNQHHPIIQSSQQTIQYPQQPVQLQQQNQVQSVQQIPVIQANQAFSTIQQQQKQLQQQQQQKPLEIQQKGIFQLANLKSEVSQQEQKKTIMRKQSLQNLQSYQQMMSSPNNLQNNQNEGTPKVINGIFSQNQTGGQVNVRSSVMSLNQNQNTVQPSQQIVQQEQTPVNIYQKIIPQNVLYKSVQDRDLDNFKQDFVVDSSNPQTYNSTQQIIQPQVQEHQIEKQPVIIREKITYVKDTAKIEELESKIRLLLDNIEQLNKTIHSKESINSDLMTKVLEIDHLKKAKTRIQEENQNLKLQIEEWQRRYNVLELSGYDKSNTQFIATGYTAYDAERLYNSLKIKQEENDILKTTIARLELGQGQELSLKEEIDRLNDHLDLKTRQCEEWKQKYINLETVSTKNKFKVEYGEQQIGGYGQNDNVQVNSETPKMSCVFNEQSYIGGKDITQLGRYVNEREETPKRSNSGSVSYNTSALFKKKNALNSPSNNPLIGVTSYIDDIKLNKKLSSHLNYN